MQMGFEEEGVGARAPDREIGLGFGGGYGKITGSTSHPRIHVDFEFERIRSAVSGDMRSKCPWMGTGYMYERNSMDVSVSSYTSSSVSFDTLWGCRLFLQFRYILKDI